MALSNLRLRVGTNRLIVDTEEISAVSVNYSLKQIQNYGKRNSSFTRPISILQTKNTDKIFKALFNINSIGGYDVATKVSAELEENGITILIGTLEIIDIKKDTYEVVLSANTNSIITDLGDKLIYGNESSSDDISWTGTPYQHDITIDHIRQMLNSDPSNNGEGYIYTCVDYDGKLAYPSTYSIWDIKTQVFQDNYKIYPAIAVKQIFDKIIEDAGYSYTMDASMQSIVEKMYMPFNGDWLDLTEDWYFAKYYFGNPTGYAYADVYVPLSTTWNYEFHSPLDTPKNTVKGYTFADSYLGGSYNVSGGFDDQLKQASNWSTLDYNIVIPHAGTYQIDVSMYCFNTDAAAAGTVEWVFRAKNYLDELLEETFNSVEIAAATGSYINHTFTVTVSEKSEACFYKSAESSSLINLIFGPWSAFTITEINAYYTGKTIDINDLLPRNYKQKDLVNDIFKMFNAYITVDATNEKKIDIKPYPVFYDTDEYIDWSDKIDESSMEFKSIKNSFAKTTTFSFLDDSDIYSSDYLNKYPEGIYSNQIVNDSEFTTAENSIKLNCAQGIQKSWPGTVGTRWVLDASVDPNWEMELLVINDDSQWKTAWKPRILFANTYDVSVAFGVDRLYNSDTWLSKLNTLSPRMLKDTSDTDNIFLGFNSVNTYVNNSVESNQNLYNKYYKEDILENIDDQSFLLTADFNLNSIDINSLDFAKKVRINSVKHGSAWYYINAIKDYTPGAGLTKVELIKYNLVDSAFDTEITTNRIYKSQLGTNETAGGGSTSSGSASAAGNIVDLQTVTSVGNLTSNGIVFQSPDTTSSQVGLNADVNNNLTIDGGVKVSSILNVTDDTSLYGQLYVREDVSLYSNLRVREDIFTSDLTASGNVRGNNVQSVLDVSVGRQIYMDKLESKTDFISGWTGTGTQYYKDSDGKYSLEVDDLRVRGSMSVYELILNKIRATNGSLWVTDAVEAVWPGVDDEQLSAGLYFDTNTAYNFFYTDVNLNTLRTNDYILSQQFLGNNVHRHEWIVQDSSGTQIYVKKEVDDRIDGLGPVGYIGDPNMGCANINMSKLAASTLGPGDGYDFVGTSGSQFRTNYFTLNGQGWLGFSYDTHVSRTGSMSYEVRDGAGTKISTGTYAGTILSTKDVSIKLASYNPAGDTSCYVLFTMSSDASAVGFAITRLDDNTLDSSLDVTGWTFVRMGNPTDTTRQGAIYLTASDTNSPYIEVLDGMTDHNINDVTKKKVRLGKLNGLSWEGNEIDGYGLWTENAYLSGFVNSISGNIAGWSIEGDSITGFSEDGSSYIDFDRGQQKITLGDYDSVSVEIMPTEVTEFDDIVAGNNVIYTGAKLKTYSDASVVVTSPDTSQTDVVRYKKDDSHSGYLEVLQTGTPSVVDYFDMGNGTSYNMDFYIDVSVEFGAIPDSSILVSGRPWPEPESAGLTTTTNEYELVGGWRATGETNIYGPAGVLSESFNATTGAGTLGSPLPMLAGDLKDWKLVNNKSFIADGSSYIRLTLDIYSEFAIEKTTKYWVSEDIGVLGDPIYRWELENTSVSIQNINVTFTYTPSKFNLYGQFQRSQLGKGTILAYRDNGFESKYFTFNPWINDKDFLMKGSCDWNIATGGEITIHDNNYDGTSYSDTALRIETAENKQVVIEHHQTNAAYAALQIQDSNASGSTTHMPLLIRSGTTGGGNIAAFHRYNGTAVGSITHNGTNTTYGTSSDARLKDNIRDTSIDACKFLLDISVREWEWASNGKSDIGFIAQEALEYYPDMVQIPQDPSVDMYGVGTHHLIPHLVKAIQELTIYTEQQNNRIITLETQIAQLLADASNA